MARTPKFDDTEILDRAMSLVWSQGLAHTSIRDLEAALDLKAPSIYRRFGSKEGLAVAAVDHYVERVVRRRVDKRLCGLGDPIDNVSSFLRTSVTEPDQGGRLIGCLLTTASLEAGDADPALVAALERGLDVIESGLRGELERAGELGRLASGVDADTATATMVLVMQGLMALARSGAPAAALQRRADAALSTIGAQRV